MAFMETTPSGTYVSWGKENARENSVIVEEGKSITGVITQLKDSAKYGFVLEIKTKEHDEPLVVLGSAVLLTKMGYQKNEQGIAVPVKGTDHVKEEEVVRITYLGQIPTKHGKKAYDFKVEVDR